MYSEPADRQPPEVSTSGGCFLPSVVSPSFLWSGQRKEAKETPQPQAGRTHRACFVLPPSLRSEVAPMGALLYASRWRTHARSIGRLWGRKAPQSWGYPSSPESSPRGAFFCGRKPPLPPKKPLRISPQLITLWWSSNCLPPIGRVVRFITAKLACARAYTSLQGYMNDEKKSPALRFASGSIFFPRPCLRLSGAHCLTAYENDDNTTDRLRHKKVDHPI